MEYKPLLTFTDIACGCGGFRIALESFGLKCAFSCDWDKHCQKTYYENFGDWPAGDITKIDADSIQGHDILCAGFPCQSFSISGKQLGFDDVRGTLFFDIARIIEKKRPKVLLFENVKNFEKHDGGRTLKKILDILDNLEYNVFYKVLNASEHGVATSRKRIYFVCFRRPGPDHFAFPEPEQSHIYLKDIIDFSEDYLKFEIKRDDIQIAKIEPQTLQPRPVQIGIINKGGQGERVYSINGHAITLSAYGGGAASKTGAYLVNGIVRRLTPRECARVMGFPEDFKIPVSDAQAYKQFGNSVAIPVVKKIVEQIMKAYHG